MTERCCYCCCYCCYCCYDSGRGGAGGGSVATAATARRTIDVPIVVRDTRAQPPQQCDDPKEESSRPSLLLLVPTTQPTRRRSNSLIATTQTQHLWPPPSSWHDSFTWCPMPVPKILPCCRKQDKKTAVVGRQASKHHCPSDRRGDNHATGSKALLCVADGVHY